MDSVNEELLEEVLRNVASICEELAEDLFVEVHKFQGRSVIHVARSKKKVGEVLPCY